LSVSLHAQQYQQQRRQQPTAQSDNKQKQQQSADRHCIVPQPLVKNKQIDA